MPTISHLLAREILDSRGNPTVEAEVILNNGIRARAAVPSGASTGSREALELRDHNLNRYGGKGVLTAVNHIQTHIFKALKNQDITQQSRIDHLMINLDNTDNKSFLGANAILAVSMACAKAAALSLHQPLYNYLNNYFKTYQHNNADKNSDHSYILPVPMMNIINGGSHADNNIDIQEFMILPVNFSSFKEALRAGAEIFQALKKILHTQKFNTNVGDEGGFAPTLPSNMSALDYILEAIYQAGFSAGKDIYLGLDIASSEFYKDSLYHLKSDQKSLSSAAFADYLENLVQQYPIISIEDGMAENDWEGWKILSEKLGKKIQLVGDDLFVTNKAILQEGIDKNIANAILIKLNQIGTLTETFEAVITAKKSGYKTIISHRSGETEDSFIADLSVGVNAGQIKTGSLCRSDRTAKYNQLLRIEEELTHHAIFPGKTIYSFL